ncbi:hypothetical protein [Emticicia fontis]
MEENTETKNKQLLAEAQNKLLVQQYKPEQVVRDLIAAGIEEDKAIIWVKRIMRYQKEEGDRQVVHKEKEQKRIEITIGISFIISVIAAAMQNPAVILFALVVSGITGYYSYPEKPMAGIISHFVGAIIFMIISYVYFGDRKHYISFELLIPFIPGIFVAFFVRFGIVAFFYKEK